MNALDLIRKKIRFLHENHPEIHINVSIAHPKLELRGVTAVIREVYPNVFRIETQEKSCAKLYTLQYADVLTHRIEILELEKLEVKR